MLEDLFLDLCSLELQEKDQKRAALTIIIRIF